jgi:ABC-type dipeptide/oligopeptide/nickel transport system permease subunit
MNTVSFFLGAFILISLILLGINDYRKKYSVSKMFVRSTLLLFLYTGLLLVSLYILDKEQTESSLWGTNIYDGLLSFALWYYFIPVFFLAATILSYLWKSVSKAKSTRMKTKANQ